MPEHPSTSPLGPLAALLAEIAQEPPLPQLLEQTLDAACRLAHADTGIIGLYDPGADVMRTMASHMSIQARVAKVYERGDGTAICRSRSSARSPIIRSWACPSAGRSACSATLP
jgi:GAF domain-containing protein